MLSKEVKDELIEILKHLEQLGVEYMITGSSAMSTYSIPRFTRDIDMIIDLRIEDADVFLKYFIENKFAINPRAVRKDIDMKRMFNMVSNKTSFKYDFVIKRESPFINSEFSRKKIDQVFDIEAWVISLEDLILSKLKWAQDTESAYQIADIKMLLLVTNPDMNYIRKWVEELNLKTFNLI